MNLTVLLNVNISDLDIKYYTYENSLTGEVWGVTQTKKWIDVDIESIKYQDKEVDLTEDSYFELVQYLRDTHNEED